jgi:hypothetical protein
MGRDSAPTNDRSNAEVSRVIGRPTYLKQLFATVALGAGGIATVGWVVLLGWAVTHTFAANAPNIRAVLPASQHAAIGKPEKPAKGYMQPSNPIGTPPKHP